ncbi:cysteine desulfurase family protein [Bryobacter aggregatus]|uniref:cysteine desulfurase family protein n=1 Tax=Bryobacter aggregatus TaxID=360054 RepID=UPI0004E243FE|nr:cysteine desulfurase family protein [Bryobacter aggregatus]
MRAYFDHNSTTPLAPEAWSAMQHIFAEIHGNASSIHREGQVARQHLEAARRQVAQLLQAKAEEIVFTSGGTESNNLALFGVAGHIITTAIEHPAVLNVTEELQRLGHAVTVVPVGATGIVDPENIRRAIRPETRAISVMAVNNEIGTVQPVAEIGAIAREHQILFHCDAVQAPGRIPIDVNAWQVDLLSLSAHKLYGPKGIGALYVRKGTPLRKRSFGGHHERDRRPGTENVPGAVGFGRAASVLSIPSNDLRDRLEAAILATVPNAIVNGDRDHRAPNTTNICFSGVEGESLVIALDLKGFAVSSGSACSSGSVEPSPVLLALGRSPSDARSAIRFSLGASNTEEQVDALARAIAESVSRLRKLSPAYV